MKSIKLYIFQRPDKKSIFTNVKKFSVFFNSQRFYFSSERDCLSFLAQRSLDANKRIIRLNSIYKDVFSVYRDLFFGLTQEDTNKLMRKFENIDYAFKFVFMNEFSSNYHSYVVKYINMIADNLAAALNRLIGICEKRNLWANRYVLLDYLDMLSALKYPEKED